MQDMQYVEVKELLLKKIEVYQKNIRGTSVEDQKHKYAKAFKKLREEIFSLISRYACEEVYGNLYVMEDEEGISLIEYGKNLVMQNGKHILAYGIEGNIEDLDKLLYELRKEYVKEWCTYSPKATEKLLLASGT